MKVSIIIPNYNGLKFLTSCLGALKKQSFQDFDIIFVDNASVDGSVDFIKKNYEGVKIIELSKNYGFSKAVNEGIKASSSEFVVLLNNDTEAEENWLYELASCIKQSDRIFSCSSKMMQFHDRGKIDDAGDEYNLLGWAYKRGDNRPIAEFSRNRETFSTCAGAAIYRKKVFDEIGYFDEGFFAYLEDVDLSYRARIYGYQNVYCSNAGIYHVGSGTSGSKYNSFKVRLAARNNLFVVYKNMPVLQLIINSPFLFIGFLVKYIFFARKGFRRDYEAGIREFVKEGSSITRTKFKWKNLFNYIKIEGLLIKNTFSYMKSKLRKFHIFSIN